MVNEIAVGGLIVVAVIALFRFDFVRMKLDVRNWIFIVFGRKFNS